MLMFTAMSILLSMVGHTSNLKGLPGGSAEWDSFYMRNSVRLRPLAACNLPIRYQDAIGGVDSEELMATIINADVPPGVVESDFYFRADGLYLRDELIAVFCDVRGRSQ